MHNVSSSIGADSILSPLLYSYYTRLDEYCPCYICDFPKLMYINNASLKVSPTEMKNIFRTYLGSIENNNFFFDYKLMNYEIFLKPKIDYMAELARQITYSSKRVVFLIDYKYHDHFIETWKQLSKNIQPINSFYKGIGDKNNTEFVDYVENLAIIDILEDFFIFENFIEHKVIFYLLTTIQAFNIKNNF